MGEIFEGWTWWVEDAFLLHTPDEPDWLRPKYHTRTEKDEPQYTVDEEIAMMNEQIEASEGFDIDFSKFRCLFNYHPVDFNDKGFVEEPETNADLFKRVSQKSLDNYNKENNTEYEFDKLVKANFHMSAGVMLLITFQVKDPSDSSLLKEFQARVHYSFVDESDYVFCRPKPEQEDSTNEDGVEVAEKDDKKPGLEQEPLCTTSVF
ncbi:uncharacterized protein LOC111831899 [Capsella rubella]|uniref:uncharacterized protein LOC111831899 n=1 Tax=Capsella rubella TaxID=81985 RepID=UPI000CD4C076|nr:uncharacterized protein LOC111831899 [Capsella rubella]